MTTRKIESKPVRPPTLRKGQQSPPEKREAPKRRELGEMRDAHWRYMRMAERE